MPEQGLVKRKAMYDLIEDPHLLEFFMAPEKYNAWFRELYR